MASATTLSLRRGDTPRKPQPLAPRLVVAFDGDHPAAPPSAHVLSALDLVTFGRGDRSWLRDTAAGLRRLALKLPDRWMSNDHGRLVRTPDGWLLEDERSKNGCVVNGKVTRRIMLADGDVVELGAHVLLFQHAASAPGAALDRRADELAAPTPALATFHPALADRFAALAQVAATELSVVLLGETGTGKEVVARALHELSGRRGAFVAVNCGALAGDVLEAELFGHRRGAFTGAVGDRPGLVRAADGGTLFLDEIGELPPAAQVSLLRVLQEKEVLPVGEVKPVAVDLRVCAATHRDIEAMVERGEFRSDLYARLFGLQLELAPLRERPEDLGLLIGALLQRIAGGDDATFTPEASRAMFLYDWPRNVRELEKSLAAAVALGRGRAIEVADLPGALQRAGAPPAAPRGPAPQPPGLGPEDEALHARLTALLVEHDGNVAAVAREMGKGRMQIHRWAARLGIELERYRK
jgi:transcriptional regulator with GAF, ATPase, and Fis domain